MNKITRFVATGIVALAVSLGTAVGATAAPTSPADGRVLLPADDGSVGPGMIGAKVLDIQHKLMKIGYLPGGSNTGAYDAATKAAVSRIQKAYGYPVTGIATPATQNTINTLHRWALEKDPPGTIKPGAKGTAVFELQRKLFRIRYINFIPTGTYDKRTQDAVALVQKGNKFKWVTGWATPETVTAINAAVTRAQKQVMPAGQHIPGMYGVGVLNIQKALIALGYLPSTYNNGWYDLRTKQAVSAFQWAAKLPTSGDATPATLKALNAAVAKRNAEIKARKLDSRCMTGRAICIDKTARKVHWVVNGKVLKTLDARFARPGYSTPTGAYKVQRKIYLDISRAYNNARMPFSIYYQGGRAVHYSYGFAAEGYNGGSHGCVNLRDWAGAEWLYNQSRVGDKVIIYYS